MDAVIVAAGRGTRMRPLTDTRPKPLLPLGTTTILERTMGQCAEFVDRYVLVVGYRAGMIRDRIGEEYAGRPVEYVEQEERLGTAHAIGRAGDVVDDEFLALNGDVVVDHALIEKLAEVDGHALAVTPVEHPENYGVVDTAEDRVTGLVEKPSDPPSNRVNVGLYSFGPSAFEAIAAVELSPRGEYEITDAIAQLIDDESVTAVDYDGTWMDVGRPWELLDATEAVLSDLQGTIEGSVSPDASLDGEIVVENGARVRAGTTIEGPVVIKAGANVGPNAFIRGKTVVGPAVRVGNAVEVKNSILLSGATVPHLSYVGDSILGADVNFGAGTTVANLRHDDQPVRVTVKGDRVDTGRRKFGVVVGDESKTGIDTNLNAGVTLGVGARTGPGETVLRDKETENNSG